MSVRLKYVKIFIFIVILFISYLVFEVINLKLITNYSNSKSEQKILNVYFWGDIPKFNPMHPDGLYVWWIQNLIWDRIVNIDHKLVWTPSVAESWEFNSDLTELKLKIKPNLKWSNGRNINTKDFIFSFHFFKDESLKSAIYKPILERIKIIEFKNNSLVLKLDSKFQKDPFFSSHTYWSQVLSTVRLYPYDLKNNPYLGTGPYKVKQFSNQGQIVLTQNFKSWFFETYLNNKSKLSLPKIIKIRSLNSDSVLEKILIQNKGLVLGRDLNSLQIKSWIPFEPKITTVSIGFNLNSFNFDERTYLLNEVQKVNDLEKLNLKFRNIQILKTKESSLQELTRYNKNKLNNNVKKNFNLEVLYTDISHEQWLTYLNEKLRSKGIHFVLKPVSDSVLNEKIRTQKYEVLVDKTIEEDFYPHYLMYHSKGAYNFRGFSDKQLDHDLEKLVFLENQNQIDDSIQKIKKQLDQFKYEIPLFSFETSVLWTRNPCKPIESQFQGLGLIYKAIICADNL